jgi:hypothetical protein
MRPLLNGDTLGGRMGLVDYVLFEARGARGCSNSEYAFALTTCCERIGVVDWQFNLQLKE